MNSRPAIVNMVTAAARAAPRNAGFLATPRSNMLTSPLVECSQNSTSAAAPTPAAASTTGLVTPSEEEWMTA